MKPAAHLLACLPLHFFFKQGVGCGSNCGDLMMSPQLLLVGGWQPAGCDSSGTPFRFTPAQKVSEAGGMIENRQVASYGIKQIKGGLHCYSVEKNLGQAWFKYYV